MKLDTKGYQVSPNVKELEPSHIQEGSSSIPFGINIIIIIIIIIVIIIIIIIIS